MFSTFDDNMNSKFIVRCMYVHMYIINARTWPQMTCFGYCYYCDKESMQKLESI